MNAYSRWIQNLTPTLRPQQKKQGHSEAHQASAKRKGWLAMDKDDQAGRRGCARAWSHTCSFTVPSTRLLDQVAGCYFPPKARPGGAQTVWCVSLSTGDYWPNLSGAFYLTRHDPSNNLLLVHVLKLHWKCELFGLLTKSQANVPIYWLRDRQVYSYIIFKI